MNKVVPQSLVHPLLRYLISHCYMLRSNLILCKSFSFNSLEDGSCKNFRWLSEVKKDMLNIRRRLFVVKISSSCLHCSEIFACSVELPFKEIKLFFDNFKSGCLIKSLKQETSVMSQVDLCKST